MFRCWKRTGGSKESDEESSYVSSHGSSPWQTPALDTSDRTVLWIRDAGHVGKDLAHEDGVDQRTLSKHSRGDAGPGDRVG
jgi:hypothetical protein